MLGTIIRISANSWFTVWIGLEINLLSLIPLISSSKNLFYSESSLKYFLTQTIASIIIIYSFFYIFFILKISLRRKDNFNYLALGIQSALLLKRGAAPFHFWLPSVIEGLPWIINLVLLTWQKIAPLLIIFNRIEYYFILISILFSALFGRIGGLNQTSIRKIIAYSSINHLRWILSCIIFNENFWILYFIIYSFLNLNIIFFLNQFKIFNLNQIFNSRRQNIINKISLFFSIISLGGMPPTLGFFPKWLVIESLSNLKLFLILNFLLFLTLLTLFFYLRISYCRFLLNHLKINWTFLTNQKVKKIKLSIFLPFL